MQVEKTIELDKAYLEALHQMETARMEANDLQKQITARKRESKGKDACEDLMGQKNELDDKIKTLTEKADGCKAERDVVMKKIGNLVHDSVVVSKDEEKDNKIEWTYGTPRKFDQEFKTNGFRPHYEILEMLGAVEFDAGVEIAGHRGYFLTGVGVLLNQALINYALAFCCRKNYTPDAAAVFHDEGGDGQGGGAQRLR